MFVFNSCQSEKKYPEIGVKLVFFTFFINFFCANMNQEHGLLPDCAFGPFTQVYCENCMPGFSAFVFNLSKSGNILFRLIPGNLFSVQLSINCHWYLGDNSLVHELRVMADVDVHVNATHAKHPALKSVYGKNQPVTWGKLFSFFGIGKCLN